MQHLDHTTQKKNDTSAKSVTIPFTNHFKRSLIEREVNDIPSTEDVAAVQLAIQKETDHSKFLYKKRNAYKIAYDKNI